MSIINESLLKSNNSFLFTKSKAVDFDDKPFECKYMSFHLCREDQFDIDINDASYHLQNGDILILYPSDTVKIYNRGNARAFSFFMTRGFADIAFREVSAQAGHLLRTHRVIKSSDFTIKRLLKMCFFYKKSAMLMPIKAKRNMLIGNLINTVVLAISNDLKKTSNKIMDIQKEENLDLKVKGTAIIEKFMYLVDVYFKEEHKVQFYAEKLKITPNYLTNLCTDLTGQSPKNVIETKILSSLKNDLLHSDFSLQELAQQYRFPDVSYMGRFFKRNAGCTPNTFRTSVN